MCKMMRVCLGEQTFNLTQQTCEERTACASLEAGFPPKPAVCIEHAAFNTLSAVPSGLLNQICILELSELASKSVRKYDLS